MVEVIDQYIWSESHRAILKRRILDGVTMERLAEEFHYSPRQIKRIIYTGEEIIFRHIERPDNMSVN